jgi:hypothetical protein
MDERHNENIDLRRIRRKHGESAPVVFSVRRMKALKALKGRLWL